MKYESPASGDMEVLFEENFLDTSYPTPGGTEGIEGGWDD